jgi:hypothetical protein
MLIANLTLSHAILPGRTGHLTELFDALIANYTISVILLQLEILYAIHPTTTRCPATSTE